MRMSVRKVRIEIPLDSVEELHAYMEHLHKNWVGIRQVWTLKDGLGFHI